MQSFSQNISESMMYVHNRIGQTVCVYEYHRQTEWLFGNHLPSFALSLLLYILFSNKITFFILNISFPVYSFVFAL